MGASAQFLLDETAAAGAPALTFDGDSDTGIFQNNPDEISFSTGGIEKFIIESDGTLASTTAGYETLVLSDNDIPNRKYVEDTFVNSAGDSMTGDLTFIGTAQLFAADGSIADPGISFGNDTDNGFMLDTGLGINSVGIVSGGALIGDFTPNGLQMRNGAQVIGDTGNVGAPSFSFTSDLTTGIFSDGSIGEFAFSSNGSETIRFDGTSASGALFWRGGDGAAATPAVSFSSDTDTGMYSAAGDILSFATDAVERVRIDASGNVSIITGNLQMTATDQILADFASAGAPSYSFFSNANTGIYRSALNEFSFSTNGLQRWSISASGHLIPANNAQYDIGSSALPARNIFTDQVRAEFGAAGDPSYNFDGDEDTGMYRSGDNNIGFSTNGIQRVVIAETLVDFNVPLRARTTDLAAAPSYSWDGDTGTGMYEAAASAIGFATGGTERWRINSTGDWLPLATGADIATSGTRLGTVYATTFDGTATAAQYSDLAERYSVCKCCGVEPGTVMIICDHEDHEICASGKRADDRVLGVISEAPGFMMNKDAGNDDTHPYIALRGRVPVKVTGEVKKGDLLITSSIPGHAETASIDNKRFNHCAVFAKALSAGKNGMVEAVIL
jgi:hypothetical protein